MVDWCRASAGYAPHRLSCAYMAVNAQHCPATPGHDCRGTAGGWPHEYALSALVVAADQFCTAPQWLVLPHRCIVYQCFSLWATLVVAARIMLACMATSWKAVLALWSTAPHRPATPGHDRRGTPGGCPRCPATFTMLRIAVHCSVVEECLAKYTRISAKRVVHQSQEYRRYTYSFCVNYAFYPIFRRYFVDSRYGY